MGLFDFFGGKKSSEDEEAVALQNAAAQKEKEIQAAKEAHEGMEWPSSQA